jgi:hypothetical protein
MLAPDLRQIRPELGNAVQRNVKTVKEVVVLNFCAVGSLG